MAMMVSMKLTAHVMDILGEFLNGNFTDGEELFMEIPQGFESKFDKGTVLKLNRKIYGLKHPANACWNEFLASMLAMEYKRNEAIPCLYYKWKKERLSIYLSVVENCLVVSIDKDVYLYRWTIHGITNPVQ
jgi:hypothetical protein